MNKQTAVEWLVDQIKEYDFSPRENTYLIEIPAWILKEKVEQAKAMEKEQIVETWHNGYNNQSPMIDEENCGNTYYNETFGGEE